MSKKLNKFEKNQLYIRLGRSNKVVEIANKFRKNLLENETNTEVEFKYILSKLKIRYEFQKIIYTSNKFYIVDFYLPKYNSVIELDGKHHYTDEGIKEDKIRTKALKRIGITELYRLENSEVSDCIPKLKLILKLAK
jgi:very-short-patch-repair endonuclease